MIYTASGISLEKVHLSQTFLRAGRGEYPDREYHPILILSFPADAATESLLTTPTEVTAIRATSESEESIQTGTYFTDGICDVKHEGTNAYIWLWLDRVEHESRVNPAVLSRMKTLEQNQVASEQAVIGLMDQLLTMQMGV